MSCCNTKTQNATPETAQKTAAVASNQSETAAACCCSSSSPAKGTAPRSLEPELHSTSAR